MTHKFSDLTARAAEMGMPLSNVASLPPRFAERIDAAAQCQGFIQSDSYMAHLRWSEPAERQGTPRDVAEAVCRELSTTV